MSIPRQSISTVTRSDTTIIITTNTEARGTLEEIGE